MIPLFSRYEFLHRTLGLDPGSVKLFISAEFLEFEQ